jgi:eukaryotic-like serine/threonine-protein kinase
MDTPFPLGLERFEFRGRLGQGGMGVVWRAWDKELGHDVALKTLATVDADAIYRLKREFRSLAQLSHPNLINLYELFCEEDVWFFTMELVQGVSLLSWIAGQSRGQDEPTRSSSSHAAAAARDASTHHGRAKVTDESTQHKVLTADMTFSSGTRPAGFIKERIYDAMKQLALGIHALHGAGKEHRDLKPANVMVTTGGRVVMLDFGLAFDNRDSEFYEGDIERNSSSGTPAYMAPERHLGEPASFAGDWYSVGVMLYEALTGQKPFARLSDVLGAKPPTAPSELLPDVPADLSQLALDLLRRRANERPKGPEVLARLGADLASSTSAAPALNRAPEPVVDSPALQERLQRAFNNLSKGRTVQVRVQGPPGYGRVLVRHFLESLLATDRAIVLAGRCYERETVPYKVFDSIMDALTRYLITLTTHEARALLPHDIRVLTRLFPPLLRVRAVAESPKEEIEVKDSVELGRRASAALWGVFQRVALKRPLVLFVDDLQWGDTDSARLLAELLAPPSPPPLMLIVSYRSEDLKQSTVLKQLLDATEAAKELIVTDTLEVGPVTSP